MERESNQMQTLCRSGCGFYGSPATDGLCSLCYKEALKKKQQLPTTPSSHCNALTMASTASTTNHLTPLVSHTDFDIADSMSQSHLPSKKSSQEISSHSSKTLLPSNSNINCNNNSSSGSASNVASTPQTAIDVRVSTTAGASAQRESVEQSTSNSTPEPIPIAADDAPSDASAVDTDTSGEDKDGDKDKKKKNRCGVCRKKVGLTGFQCRCGGLFLRSTSIQ